MTDAEFRAWLDEEVRESRMKPEERDDLIGQKHMFDLDFPPGDTPLRRDYRGRIVGYVANERRVEGEIHALLDGAKRDHPGRMVYFEPIGFDLF
jgi:hypothetical protein